jgi:hypothetical protein
MLPLHILIIGDIDEGGAGHDIGQRERLGGKIHRAAAARDVWHKCGSGRAYGSTPAERALLTITA